MLQALEYHSVWLMLFIDLKPNLSDYEKVYSYWQIYS